MNLNFKLNRIFVLFFLFFFVFSLIGCEEKETENEVLVNEELGFSIEFPVNWTSRLNVSKEGYTYEAISYGPTKAGYQTKMYLIRDGRFNDGFDEYVNVLRNYIIENLDNDSSLIDEGDYFRNNSYYFLSESKENEILVNTKKAIFMDGDVGYALIFSINSDFFNESKSDFKNVFESITFLEEEN